MYKVMLVDDEAYMLNGLKNIINWEEHGLEITDQASNGIQALEIAKSTPIDIVLTDIKMPKMNGLELICTLKEHNSSIKFIILSGYNDFDYVKQALRLDIENYLLKPINEEELSQTLLSLVDALDAERQANIKAIEDSFILKNNILNRWATDTISPAELSERAYLLNLDLECECYIVCILRIADNEKVKAYPDSNLLRSAVIDACYNAMGDILNDEVFCDFNGDILLYFSGNAKEITYKSIRQQLQACIHNINAHPNVDVFLSIGSIETDFHHLHNSHQNANDLIEYMLILPLNSIIDYEEKSKWSESLTKEIDIRADYFANLILSENTEEVTGFIDTIYEKAFSIADTSPKYIKNLSIEMLYIINRAAKKKKIVPVYQQKTVDDICRFIYSIDSKAKLIRVIKETALNVMYTPREEPETHPLIKRTMDFIFTNISSDISLKLLSSAFNVNPSYLGQLFKNETGELFTNYLNKVRIERAMQMLAHSKLNANEIALEVGYSNTNYFYTCFKKFTGKYPTDYRRDLWNTDRIDL